MIDLHFDLAACAIKLMSRSKAHAHGNIIHVMKAKNFYFALAFGRYGGKKVLRF